MSRWRNLKILQREFLFFYKNVRNRSINKFLYFLNFLYSHYLNELTILLTFRCNKRCDFCPQWGEYGLWKEDYYNFEEIDVDYFRKLINDVKQLSPSIIVLSGGEPLLYKEWYKLANEIRNKKIKCVIITNGTKIYEYKKEIIENVDDLIISINDNINEKLITDIATLDKIKTKKTPFIKVAITIHNNNYDKLTQLLTYFKNINIDLFVIQHLMFLDKSLIKENGFFYGFLYNPAVKLAPFMQQITELRNYKNLKFVPNFNNEEIKNYYEDAKFENNRFSYCVAPYMQATVLPNGDVWLCPENKIGNIKEDSIINLWNNGRARDLRRNLRKIKKFSFCRACCYLYSY